MNISSITRNSGITQSDLQTRYLGFPNISYSEFKQLPELVRREIMSKNRILQTDTYNRFMNDIKGVDWNKHEVYVLQLRKSSDKYLIANGIQTQIEKILTLPITQEELDFAEEFYKEANVRCFNKQMWQSVIDDHQGYLPINVYAVADGTAVLPGDPVLRVEGPGELAAHFEADFHRVFYETLVSTTAHKIATLVGANRFIEVGKRSTPTEEMHLLAARATYEGGGIALSSNDAAAACFDAIIDTGTVGHRLVQHYLDEETSFRTIVEKSDRCSLLIDLVDSKEGIEKALALKQEFRDSGKVIWIRLDSGDLTELAKYTLNRYKELGFTDPKLDKVVIEDLSTPEEMAGIDKALIACGLDPINHVLYGAGGLLVYKGKGRSDASTGFKLSEVEGTPKMKFSDSPGKESLPGRPELVLLPDGTRMIVQTGEIPSAQSLFSQVVDQGRILYPNRDSEQVRATVNETVGTLAIGKPTPKSAQTLQKIDDLTKHYFN